MSTRRKVNRNAYRIPVSIDLVDGGTVGVYPMSFDQADQYVKVILRTDFERDEKGQILFNAKTGEPARKFVSTAEEEIAFALELLAFVNNIEDEETGKPIELATDRDSDRAAIIAFMKDLNAAEIELDSKGDEFTARPGQVRATDAPANEKGERPPATKTQVEPIYKTVIRESSRLRRELNERLRKNSSPTP